MKISINTFSKGLQIIFVLICTNCVSETQLDLETILSQEREDLAIMQIDEYLNKKSEYGDKINRLNSFQKTLIWVENLEREVNNGGFDQFYRNSSGDYAIETVGALERIGANQTAQIVKQANAVFSNGLVPKNRKERWLVLNEIPESDKKKWELLNDKFYRPNKDTGKMETDNTAHLLIEYVKKNKQKFQN